MHMNQQLDIDWYLKLSLRRQRPYAKMGNRSLLWPTLAKWLLGLNLEKWKDFPLIEFLNRILKHNYQYKGLTAITLWLKWCCKKTVSLSHTHIDSVYWRGLTHILQSSVAIFCLTIFVVALTAPAHDLKTNESLRVLLRQWSTL